MLQGGPGASSLYGLFKENGPISATAVNRDPEDRPPTNDQMPFPEFSRTRAHAELNKYSWNRNASLIYVDNPVGAGYSFADVEGYPRTTNQSTEDLYEFLQQFFILMPEFSLK